MKNLGTMFGSIVGLAAMAPACAADLASGEAAALAEQGVEAHDAGAEADAEAHECPWADTPAEEAALGLCTTWIETMYDSILLVAGGEEAIEEAGKIFIAKVCNVLSEPYRTTCRGAVDLKLPFVDWGGEKLCCEMFDTPTPWAVCKERERTKPVSKRSVESCTRCCDGLGLSSQSASLCRRACMNVEADKYTDAGGH